MKSETIFISIHKPAIDVYQFVSNLKNLPIWASAFVKKIESKDGKWIAQTSFGPHIFRIQPQNELGVLDHWVTPPNGIEVYVPMRVIPNGAHSEVLFTLFQSQDMSDDRFKNDVALVRQDLNSLKSVMESP